MPGNSQRRNVRQVSKKGAVKGSGGKNKDSVKGRGKTLPADERPWHKGYSGTEKLPSKTAWKQDKEKKAAATEGRVPVHHDPEGVGQAGREIAQVQVPHNRRPGIYRNRMGAVQMTAHLGSQRCHAL